METEWVVWMYVKRMEWIDGATCVVIATDPGTIDQQY